MVPTRTCTICRFPQALVFWLASCLSTPPLPRRRDSSWCQRSPKVWPAVLPVPPLLSPTLPQKGKRPAMFVSLSVASSDEDEETRGPDPASRPLPAPMEADDSPTRPVAPVTIPPESASAPPPSLAPAPARDHGNGSPSSNPSDHCADDHLLLDTPELRHTARIDGG